MKPSSWLVVLLLLAITVPAALLDRGTPAADISDVRVANFPVKQKVDGDVIVTGSVEQALFTQLAETVVTSSRRSDPQSLIAGPVLDAGGHAEVVVSVHGYSRGSVLTSGPAGVVLLPHSESVQAALREQNQLHFALASLAPLSKGKGGWFAAEPTPLKLAFPRYRVYFVNETDAPASVFVSFNFVH